MAWCFSGTGGEDAPTSGETERAGEGPGSGLGGSPLGLLQAVTHLDAAKVSIDFLWVLACSQTHQQSSAGEGAAPELAGPGENIPIPCVRISRTQHQQHGTGVLLKQCLVWKAPAA